MYIYIYIYVYIYIYPQHRAQWQQRPARKTSYRARVYISRALRAMAAALSPEDELSRESLEFQTRAKSRASGICENLMIFR